MRVLMGILVAASVWFSGPAYASDESVSGFWLEECGDNSAKFQCFALAIGLIDAHWYAVSKDKKFTNSCGVEGYSTRFLIEVWLEYLRQNPDTHDIRIAKTFFAAIEQMFPCPDSEAE